MENPKSRLASALGCAALWTLINPGAAHAQSRQTPIRVLDGTAKLVQHYDENQMLRLSFALTPPHLDEERALIEQLHDKKSPLFHQFLTADQFNARFAPSAADEQAVVDWAQSAGLTITYRYPNRLLVDVEAPAGVIEKALNVTINQYSFNGQTYFSNDRDPLLPGALAGVVQSVQGLNSFERMVPTTNFGVAVTRPDYTPGPALAMGATGAEDATAKMSEVVTPDLVNGYFDPKDLFSSQGYNYGALMNQGHCCNPLGNPNNSPPDSSIAIAAFGSVALSDISAFHTKFPYLAYNVQLLPVDGGYTCNNSGGADDNCSETTLDTEWSLATANSLGSSANTAKIFVYEAGGTTISLYNHILTDGHARVFSTSFICGGDGTACSDSTMLAEDGVLASMVIQGWTLVAASGDQGATGNCTDLLDVEYPASDPNVVAAGGTALELYTDDTFDSEAAWTGGTAAGSCLPKNNQGGSTGGFSSYWTVPSYQASMGFSKRAVPDIALNAAYGEIIIYDGAIAHPGGTSIVAPEIAGFFAQENAYLLSIGNACGGGGHSACAPLGNPNYSLYSPSMKTAAHDPYYDILHGCNSNDVTREFGLTPYCAGPGFDEVTGWGSANMLQLAWGINWTVAGTSAAPTVVYDFSLGGPWFNTNQTISWTVEDNATRDLAPTGIAGFTQGWDSIPADPAKEATQGSGNSFYSGPQFPNAKTGCLSLTGQGGCSGGVSQGCHVAHVRAWNNMGVSSGDVSSISICYDTVAPTVSDSLSPAPNSAGWDHSKVTMTLNASDPGGSAASGIAATYYGTFVSGCNESSVGSCQLYSGPVSFTAQGHYFYFFFTKDKAGNFSALEDVAFGIDETPPVTVATFSGTLSGSAYTTPVKVTLTATDNLSGVASTTYSLDGGANTAYSSPFTVSAPGTHTLKFFSIDGAGNVEATHTVTFLIQSHANYEGLDTVTQGTWTGKYGVNGAVIANDLNSPPAYATLSLTGESTATWASSTTDVRALQTASGASTRIASTYYSSSSYTINVDLKDGNSHRIALYLLDWDTTTRAETISITDADNNVVLDTESYSGFHNGEYAAWNVQGHVIIKVTKTGGSNAVVSGIFFDPPAATPAASYLGSNTGTEGTWTGEFGSKGYLIEDDASKPPVYAAVSFTGDSTFTWAASTSDVRALQTSSGAATRIASTYYSGTSETIDLNLTDGKTHKVSLYLLDWDTDARAETITISNATSKAVLSTEKFSSFNTGAYAEWDLAGHVLITLTKTGGENAVVSGIFFD
jgi:xanthomonalisin